MAKRDKREVETRFTILIAHLLKCQHQPQRRSNLWRGTIVSQRQDLEDLFESETLLKYGHQIPAKCYGKAVERAAAETGLTPEKFPRVCPYSIDSLL